MYNHVAFAGPIIEVLRLKEVFLSMIIDFSLFLKKIAILNEI